MTQADTEFALHRIAEEMPELDEERAIEAKRRAHRGGFLGCGVLSEQEHDRVADILEQHEGDQGDRDHDDQRLDEATQDEGEHG